MSFSPRQVTDDSASSVIVTNTTDLDYINEQLYNQNINQSSEVMTATSGQPSTQDDRSIENENAALGENSSGDNAAHIIQSDPPTNENNSNTGPKHKEYADPEAREQSFIGKWPESHHIKASDFAKAGFFYTGVSDCVRCFYCGYGLKGWEKNDNIWIEHARWFPTCAFLLFNVGRKFINVVQDFHNRNDGINELTYEEVLMKSKFCEQLEITTADVKRKEFFELANRENSFQNWPEDNPITAIDLAISGYFYAGYSDCVICFYCGKGFKHLKPNDNLWIEHARWFPDCAYLLLNVGRKFIDIVQDLHKENAEEFEMKFEDVLKKSNSEPMSYVYMEKTIAGTKRKEFSEWAAREKSFEYWPADYHIKAVDLARAGYFYAGYGDCAKCFYCGKGLRQWKLNDNVWIEHARWAPKCVYLLFNVGRKFIDVVQDLYKENSEGFELTFEEVLEKSKSNPSEPSQES